MNTEINLQTYNQSLNLIFGIDPFLPPEEKQSFDPLDNDYVKFVLYRRDLSDKAKEKMKINGKAAMAYSNSDFEIEKCSQQAYNNLVTPSIRF